MSALSFWTMASLIGAAAAYSLDLRADSWDNVLPTEPAGYQELPGAPLTNDLAGALRLAAKALHPNGRSDGWGFTNYTIPLPLYGSISFRWSMNGGGTYCAGPEFGFAPSVSMANMDNVLLAGACKPFCTVKWSFMESPVLQEDAQYTTTLYISNDTVSRITWGPGGELYSTMDNFTLPSVLWANRDVHVHMGLYDAYAQDRAALTLYQADVNSVSTCAQQEYDLEAHKVRFQQRCTAQKMNTFLQTNRCRKNAECNYWECDEVQEMDLANHC